MTDEKIIQDVYLLLNYFGAETKASHSVMIMRVKELDQYCPNGSEHFKGLVNACLSGFLNRDDTADLSAQAGHLEEYFTGKAHSDGVWESKLRELAATGPEVAAAINVLTDAVVEVWADQQH